MSASPEQKTILNLYALFGASIVLSVLPYASAAILATVFFLVLLVMAYTVRGKAASESLQENHATYLIRTLWITAFFSLITLTAATIYMLPQISYGPFEPCALKLSNMGAEALENAGVKNIYPIIEPCVEGFLFANETVFMNAVVISALPLMVYMGYRIAKGLGRAMKGYRLSDPKGWF